MCDLTKALICLEGKLFHLRDLALRISESGCIHIMMKNVCGKYDISNIDIIVKASCDTGIDHRFHLKEICQDLGAHAGIYLTDPGLYHNYLLSFQNTLIKIHSGSGSNGYILHNLFQSCYFLFHCSYDSNTFHDL